MKRCECGEPLDLEMEIDSNLCAECQKADGELADAIKAEIDNPRWIQTHGYAHWAVGFLWGKLQCLADGTTSANREECQRIFREFRSMYRYAFRETRRNEQ